MIKLMKQIFTLVIFFVLIVFSFSCKKKENKILGTWQYVYLTAADTNKTQTWVFNDDKSLIRSIQTTDTTIIDTATYSFNSRFLDSPNLLINELHPDQDGTYEILTLNKKYFIIQRILLSDGNSAGAFLRAEFVKK